MSYGLETAARDAGRCRILSADDDGRQPVTEQQGRVEHVHRTIAVVIADQRTVIELRDFDGLRFREIGERLGRTENAVQLLHSRAMMRLATTMKKGRGTVDP